MDMDKLSEQFEQIKEMLEKSNLIGENIDKPVPQNNFIDIKIDENEKDINKIRNNIFGSNQKKENKKKIKRK